MLKSVRTSLNKALKQLHVERSRIDRQISALSAAMGQLGAKVAARGRARAAGGRRRMSAAQKAAVSKRMKAYWAKRRAAKGK